MIPDSINSTWCFFSKDWAYNNGSMPAGGRIYVCDENKFFTKSFQFNQIAVVTMTNIHHFLRKNLLI